MRLVDVVLRQGHLSEQALVEAVMTGERPAHLDRCDICADRSVELSRWLDDVRVIGQEAADDVFTPERLAAQHAQILRKLEQVDEPSRVIAFPVAPKPEVREPLGRRVAPAWLGVAAAAGLVLGVVGGQVSARLTMQPTIVQMPSAPAATAENNPLTETHPLNIEPLGVVPASLLSDDDFESTPDVLRTLHEITPKLSRAQARAGG